MRSLRRLSSSCIAKTGANTVRLPFHYKLFTAEDYLGSNDPAEGFRRLDAAIGWCRVHGLKVILDMHDCPGGQTGANIDDSYGYPWLFRSEGLQRQYREIWRAIAARYADDPAVLDLAPVFIHAIVWSFPGMVIMRGANSLLQGTGSARLLMAFAFIDAGARVLFSWLFGIVLGAGFPGFVLGFGIAIYGICIPGACYFFFGKWAEKKSMAHAEQEA